jgi:hypothetical protein
MVPLSAGLTRLRFRLSFHITIFFEFLVKGFEGIPVLSLLFAVRLQSCAPVMSLQSNVRVEHTESMFVKMNFEWERDMALSTNWTQSGILCHLASLMLLLWHP